MEMTELKAIQERVILVGVQQAVGDDTEESVRELGDLAETDVYKRQGLQSLPKSPFESAKIDGGSAWFNFKNLTLPMLKPSLYIALLFRLMAALQEYAIIFGLTKGGPGDTLMNLSLTAHLTGFKFQKFGYALPYILVLWVIVNITAKQIVKRQRAAQKQASGLES